MIFPNRATVLPFGYVVLRSPLTAPFVVACEVSSAGAFPTDDSLRCGIATALFLERLKELLPICEGMEVICFPESAICAIWSVGCAGINRHEAGNERFLRERSSEPLGPEFCAVYREVHGEA
jgi:hypothetical protein